MYTYHIRIRIVIVYVYVRTDCKAVPQVPAARPGANSYFYVCCYYDYGFCDC